MILFPNAKINIGLYITRRRPDAYHDILTVMVPVGWKDILEITPSKGPDTSIALSGRPVDCPPDKNLVIKAYRALSDFVGGLPPVRFNLEKIIPDGAGLGGGSADAAFAIKGLNELFNLGLPDSVLASVAATIGADCPFFIYNKPAFCQGIGDKISFDVNPGIAPFSILIAKPRQAAVSTRSAYEGIVPKMPQHDLLASVKEPLDQWKSMISNQFEDTIFPLLPGLLYLKRSLYDLGAIYASMTGSGAAIYGIFKSDILAHHAANNIVGCDKIVTSVI